MLFEVSPKFDPFNDLLQVPLDKEPELEERELAQQCVKVLEEQWQICFQAFFVDVHQGLCERIIFEVNIVRAAKGSAFCHQQCYWELWALII